MNEHFRDAWYYLKRAGESAALGVIETVESAEARLRTRAGRQPAPEPSRAEALLEEVREIERRAEGEAREAIGDLHDKLAAYRSNE